MTAKIEYALYRGDEIIAIGTMGEIAEITKLKRKSIFHYGTPTYAKRVTENGRRLVKL